MFYVEVATDVCPATLASVDGFFSAIFTEFLAVVRSGLCEFGDLMALEAYLHHVIPARLLCIRRSLSDR